MSYGDSDGSDGSSGSGYGGSDNSSNSSGSYGGTSSSSTSNSGYGSSDSDNSTSSSSDSTSDSTSNNGYGSDNSNSSSSSSDDGTSNNTSNSGYGSVNNSDNGSSSDSSNTLSSSFGAVDDSSIDSSSSITGAQLDGSAGNSLNPSEGIVGGTLCSEDISNYCNSNTYSSINLGGTAGSTLDSAATTTSYSFNGYISDNYDNTVVSSYQSTLDMSGFQNTEVTEPSLLGSAWDAVAQWADQNVVQPIQTALNTTLQTPESTSVTDLLVNNVPGMTSEEVENGLSAMGVTSTNVTPTANMIGDDPDAINSWAAANGVTPATVTQSETPSVGNVLSQAVSWDDDHGNPVKNTALNSGDAGVALGINSLKEVTVGQVSVPALGVAAELEVAERSFGIAALKGISKLTGPLNISSTGYDIYGDCQKYEGENLAGAVGADLVAYGVGVGAAALCVVASAPVVTGIGICTLAAVGAGLASNYFKSNFLSERN